MDLDHLLKKLADDKIIVDSKTLEQAKKLDTKALFTIGDLYLPNNPDQALAWFNRDVSILKYRTGLLYLNRLYDYKQAMEFLLEAVELGNLNACYWIGVMYNSGLGMRMNYKVAMDWYLKAEKENTDAQTDIGLLYYSGFGVDLDYEEAKAWFLKAVRKDSNPKAQHCMGLLYQNGLGGVDRDMQQALSWYQKSADQGYKYAKDKLVILNERGY